MVVRYVGTEGAGQGLWVKPGRLRPIAQKLGGPEFLIPCQVNCSAHLARRQTAVALAYHWCTAALHGELCRLD